ncbi:MAG: hypothetical protein Q9210_007023 [Variospora velana]
MNAVISPNSVANPMINEHQDPSFAELNLSKQYPTPPLESVTSFAALKGRIRHHYELASEYYYSLWGEHLHHGYFLHPADTKERAQTRLIELLLHRARLKKGSNVLDVGCGMGGTSRYLAKHHGCNVTGVTISGKQVEMAVRLTMDEAGVDVTNNVAGDPMKLAAGSARFIELDAEELGQHFPEPGTIDCVWISEAMSHLPDKKLFFQNAARLLTTNGKLVIADWFKAEDLTLAQFEADIKPIEGRFQQCSLKSPPQLADSCKTGCFSLLSAPKRNTHNSGKKSASKYFPKVWISARMSPRPALWAFAFSQGRDGIAFLQAFLAMRRGYANGAFRYAVMVFQKPVKD